MALPALPALSLMNGECNSKGRLAPTVWTADIVYDLFGVRLRPVRDFLGWGIAFDFFEG